MREAQQKPTYQYPWQSLEEDLQTRGLTTIRIVAYGSLMNPLSARKALPLESATGQPAISFGVRRVFNYERRPKLAIASPANAVLNILLTNEISDVVNGIVLEIPLKGISAMRDREVNYDLVPVACIKWNDTKEPPFIAYVFSCPDRRNGKILTKDTLTPHPGYYSRTREAAAQISESFLQLWLVTTYLADRVTAVAEWEKSESDHWS
jgi:hypothetical protein